MENNIAIQGLEVTQPGMNTQIQDSGRFGFLAAGVSQCGYLDARSAIVANRLCGNPFFLPLLEIPWGSFKATAHIQTIIAVTGAAVVFTVNGVAQPLWQSVMLRPGDAISLSAPESGVWSYLAVRGGFQVPPVLNSTATCMREKLGGITQEGSAIQKYQVLPAQPSAQSVELAFKTPLTSRIKNNVLNLRLIPCAQYPLISRIQKRAFLSTEFTLSNDYSRMGYRLQGSNNVLSKLPKITPDAIGYGAVQVPPSGQPIILLNDRQTLGGYCKIGAVVSPDCHQMVQCRPGTKVRFSLIRPTEAQKVVKNYWHDIKKSTLVNQSG